MTGCLGSSVTAASIDTLNVGLSAATIVINQGTRSRNVTNAVNKILSFFTSPQRIADKNAEIAHELLMAPIVCDNGGVFPQGTDDGSAAGVDALVEDWKWELSVLVIGCCVCLGAFLYAYYYWGKAGKVRCLRSAEPKDRMAR